MTLDTAINPFAALYACWLSEQIHPRQWAQHLSDTPGLWEYVEARERERLERRSA